MTRSVLAAPAPAPRKRSVRAEPPTLLSVAEAARLLSISERSLWSALRRGDILKVKVGRRALVPRAEIERIAAGG